MAVATIEGALAGKLAIQTLHYEEIVPGRVAVWTCDVFFLPVNCVVS